eukprot:363732-Chlamydomonas_euryale.AAC.14
MLECRVNASSGLHLWTLLLEHQARTDERNHLAVVKAHATKDVPDVWGALVGRRQAAVGRTLRAVSGVRASRPPRDDRAYKKCGAQGASEAQVRKGEGGAKGVQASRAPRDGRACARCSVKEVAERGEMAGPAHGAA